MNYVGIYDWPEKRTLLSKAPSEEITIPSSSLVFDCERHIQFLEAYHTYQDNFVPSRTLYFQYHKFQKNASIAKQKCDRFLSLFNLIRTKGFQDIGDPISVANNGARLNGSHRSAIAYYLNQPNITVREYDWSNYLHQNRLRNIHREIALKNQFHHRWTGKTVRLQDSKSLRYTVSFTDLRPVIPKRLWLSRLINRSCSFEVVFALESGSHYRYASSKMCIPEDTNAFFDHYLA
jgi:hypothetical protein